MSDLLRVACSCGCENRLPTERRGKIVCCVACGCELIVPADASVHRDDSNVVAIPINVPPATILPGLASAAPRSPFEDDPIQSQGAVPGLTGRFTNYAPPAREPIGENCSRCSNELRGEWDRIETSAGVLCYICANQGTDGIPERLKNEVVAENESHVRRSHRNAPRVVLSKRPFSRLNPQSLGFKVVVAFAATLFLVFAYLVAHFELPVPGGLWPAAGNPTSLEIDQLSIVPWTLFMGWRMCWSGMPVFFAMYLSLLFNNSFPSERFTQNVLYAFAHCVPFVAINALQIILVMAAGGDPVFAAIVVVFMIVAQARFLVNIAFEHLEDGPSQCASFVLFLLCGFLVMPYLNDLVFRGLSLL